MIVPMKKAAVIVLAKDAEAALEKLRGLGVLHVRHERPPQGADLNRLREDLACVDAAVGIVSQKEFMQTAAAAAGRGLTDARAAARQHPRPKGAGHRDWRSFARHVVDLDKRKERLEEYARHLKTQIAQWEAWGDFSPRDIESLAEKGIHTRLYSVPVKELKNLPPDVPLTQIGVRGGIARCVVVSRERAVLPFKEVPLPHMGLSEMRARLDEDGRALASIKEEIRGHAAGLDVFQKAKNLLHGELEFLEALAGMGTAGPLLYVTGFLPADQTAALSETARRQKWGLVLTEPSDEDAVPTLIRNPRWVALINPIFKFLEIVPGYREFDISLPFLVFFSIFFGMLIGDAGYGLVYLLLAFLLRRKMRKKARQDSLFFLFYLLSFCAVIWGALTGIFFGQEWILKAGYKPLLPALNDEKGIQRFCFFLGALHLSIAHGWRGILRAPALTALGDLGWLCILWGAFFIAKTLILGDVFPPFCLWLVILGATLVIIFTSPRKNILTSAEEWISWFITLPFSFIGNFADVVSYIRLFAVGLAGVAIADAFNAMAAMLWQGNMLMIVLAAFVALIGNCLGMVLGPVSVLVHGVRLNLLEFSGHMGLSWSGSPYKPLKEQEMPWSRR